MTDQDVSDVNRTEGSNPRTTAWEPDFDFKTKDKSKHSTTTRDSVDNFKNDSKKPFSDQDVTYNRQRENVKARTRLPSTGSASTSSSSNTNNRIVPAEDMETKFVPDLPIKTEPSKNTTFIKPKQCSHCSKKTFNVCKECGQNFCNAVCSLDGWRNHFGEECVEVAELIYSDSPNSRNTSIDIDRNVSLAYDSMAKPSNERNSSFTNNSKPTYASDCSSPATEYREFPNLVRDYTSKGNKSLDDASPKVPKFEPVVDNNYDDNSPQDAPLGGVEQSQQTAYQQRTSRTYRQRDSRKGAGDHERNSGANENERGGYSRSFNKRDDRDGTSNNYDRSSGRNFRQRDNRDGANDFERGSGGARNFSGDTNRGQERKSYDSAADSERSSGGNRSYSRDSNHDRDGHWDPDRRRNFNDRPNRRSTDVVDNAVSPDGARPPRGSYHNDRNDATDNSGDFETGAKPQGGFQQRNNAQNRNSGYPTYTENDINFEGNSSFDRNSKKMPDPKKVKSLEENKIFKVTVVSINQATGSCYVRLADNESIFQNMVKCINSENLTSLQKFSSSIKCVAMYKNTWHRGVLRIEPLRVYFIDFGCESHVDERSLRIVPEQFVGYRPFAWQIMLPNVPREDLTQWLSENKLISIRTSSFSKDDRYFIADVVPFEQQLAEARKECKHEQQSPVSVPATSVASVPSPPAVVQQKPKHVGETLQIGVVSEVIVTFIKSENQFFVAFKKPCIEITQKLAAEDIPSLSPLLEIQEGSLALAEFMGDWYRVKVLSEGAVKVKVSFIDYGNIEECEAKTLKLLPVSYTNIPPSAIEVKLHRGTVAAENVAENALITITPLQKESDSTWLVAIGDKSKEYPSLVQELQSLSLSPPTIQPATRKPRVNVDIFITFAESKRVAYGVYRSNGKALESIVGLSGPFDPISTPTPVLDRIYAKQYEDLWCRARVTSVNPIKIYFIDYGNSEECTVDQLFEISEELRNNPPPLAVKMVLEKESKGVLEYGTYVGVSWDQDNDTYLLTRDPTDISAISSLDITTPSIVSS